MIVVVVVVVVVVVHYILLIYIIVGGVGPLPVQFSLMISSKKIRPFISYVPRVSDFVVEISFSRDYASKSLTSMVPVKRAESEIVRTTVGSWGGPIAPGLGVPFLVGRWAVIAAVQPKLTYPLLQPQISVKPQVFQGFCFQIKGFLIG